MVLLSLSARRAWIEIRIVIQVYIIRTVALRKESVDRNIVKPITKLCNVLSLSARRAWIEIPAGCWRESRRAVALRKESVDRNLWWGVRKAVGSLMSLSARRAWIEIWSAVLTELLILCRSPQGERG